MQITFSKEEFVAMLAHLWGIPLGLADLVFDFDELTGDIRTFTITGMDPGSLSKIGAVTQGSAPKTRQPQKPITEKYDSLPAVTEALIAEETLTPKEENVDLDEIIKISRELALQGLQPSDIPEKKQNELLLYPGASEEFPLEFANRVLGK